MEKIACPKPIEKVPDEPTEETGDVRSAGATAPTKKKNKKGKKKSSVGQSSEVTPSSEKVARVAAILAEKAKSTKGDTSPPKPEGHTAYKPGHFQEEFHKFVREKKAEGASHRDALLMWKSSMVRERLLHGLPEPQRKKRRF